MHKLGHPCRPSHVWQANTDKRNPRNSFNFWNAARPLQPLLSRIWVSLFTYSPMVFRFSNGHPSLKAGQFETHFTGEALCISMPYRIDALITAIPRWVPCNSIKPLVAISPLTRYLLRGKKTLLFVKPATCLTMAWIADVWISGLFHVGRSSRYVIWSCQIVWSWKNEEKGSR